MNVIVDGILGLLEALGAALDFFWGMIKDLVLFAGWLVEMIPAAPAFWTWLPSGLAYLLGLAVSVVVVLRILGRSE